MIKRRKITHPTGFSIETPLLVPSFSSKGFEIDIKGKDIIYETSFLQEEISPFINESTLLSAYDIYYGIVKKPSLEYSFIPEIVIIDSGGYESSLSFDLVETHKHGYTNFEWDIEKYKEVIASWNTVFPAIIVSFDKNYYHKPICQQIDESLSLFEGQNEFLKTFLIKPSNGNCIFIEEIIQNIEKLHQFDIIGLTEKELGGTFRERIVNIQIIRAEMEKHNIDIPIHLFGCLNPIHCVLYAIAGIDIFDGLSWQRYVYHEMNVVHISSFMSNLYLFDENDNFFKQKIIQQNITYLHNLRKSMIKYSFENNFDVFECGERIKKSCNLLNLI